MTMPFSDTTGTWDGGTMMVPGRRQHTWTTGRRLTTSWHTVTSALRHFGRTHDRDLRELLDGGNGSPRDLVGAGKD